MCQNRPRGVKGTIRKLTESHAGLLGNLHDRVKAILIALSTVKAMGLRVLRSDRPRTELLVWVLAGGLLHGGDLWRVDKVEFVPIAAGVGLGGGWIARRENRRRVVNLVQDLIVGIMAAVRTRATTRHLAGMLVEASVVHRTRWSCQRRTMRPPPVGV